jgi:hypothetical protein
VVFTPPPNSANAELARRRAAGVQRVLSTIPGGSLLKRVQREMALGQLSYYIYLLTCLVFIASAWQAAPVTLLRDPAAALSTFGGLGLASLTDPLDTVVRIAREAWSKPWLFGGLAVGFAIAYVLTLFVDSRMSAAFSGFWFVKQEELRDALKQARVDTREATAGPRPIAVPEAASAVA